METNKSKRSPEIRPLSASGEGGEKGEYRRCLNAAYQFLKYRARSEAETRARLKKRGFEIEDIEKVIAYLQESKALDDTAFAELWKESRDSRKPRSRLLIKAELRSKGVKAEVIENVLKEADDSETAYRAAQKKAGLLAGADYEDFYRKLGGYLQRRGFSYQVTHATVRLLWQECRRLPGDSDTNTVDLDD